MGHTGMAVRDLGALLPGSVARRAKPCRGLNLVKAKKKNKRKKTLKKRKKPQALNFFMASPRTLKGHPNPQPCRGHDHVDEGDDKPCRGHGDDDDDQEGWSWR